MSKVQRRKMCAQIDFVKAEIEVRFKDVSYASRILNGEYNRLYRKMDELAHIIYCMDMGKKIEA